MRLRHLLTIALTILLGPHCSPTHAQTNTQLAVSLPQLMLRLNSVKSATARFVERKYLHILNSPLEDSGTLIYVAPGELQKITLQPKLERLLVDRDTLTIERDGEAKTLRLADYPQVWGLIEGIRATLAGDFAALDRFYEARLDGSLDAWELYLEPREERMRAIVQSVRIYGTDIHLTRIETNEQDGDHTDMTIIEDIR